MSQGLRAEPYSGMASTRIAWVFPEGCGSSTPKSSALSVAMIAAPPEVEAIATPGAVDFGDFAKKRVVSISVSKSSTSTMPARAQAAS